jgi:plastocyanin domain-containing protein
MNIDSTGLAVLLGGIALSVGILWYFFGPKKRTRANVSSRGIQEVNINVKGAYSPNVIAVKRGVPVRLNFYRDETSSCSEEVILSDFGIARKLPAFQTTSIEFTPDKTGEFTFTCGMNMLHGKLVVEAS